MMSPLLPLVLATACFVHSHAQEASPYHQQALRIRQLVTAHVHKLHNSNITMDVSALQQEPMTVLLCGLMCLVAYLFGRLRELISAAVFCFIRT